MNGTAPHLWPLAIANLLANIGIVVTGGAVRLTGSGLGCPTWPRCTDESYVAHGELGLHGAIEFGNRLVTFLLAAVAIATFVAAWKYGRRPVVRLAFVLGLGVPAQAVVGGITVLTETDVPARVWPLAVRKVNGIGPKAAARLEGRTRCNKIVVFEGSARHIGQLMDLKIPRVGAFTLYGDPAIVNLD